MASSSFDTPVHDFRHRPLQFVRVLFHRVPLYQSVTVLSVVVVGRSPDRGKRRKCCCFGFRALAGVAPPSYSSFSLSLCPRRRLLPASFRGCSAPRACRRWPVALGNLFRGLRRGGRDGKRGGRDGKRQAGRTGAWGPVQRGTASNCWPCEDAARARGDCGDGL